VTHLRKMMLEDLQGRKNYGPSHGRPENKALGVANKPSLRRISFMRFRGPDGPNRQRRNYAQSTIRYYIRTVEDFARASSGNSGAVRSGNSGGLVPPPTKR